MNEMLSGLLQNTIGVAALVPLVWCVARWRYCRPAEQNLLWLILMAKLVLPPVWIVDWREVNRSLANVSGVAHRGDAIELRRTSEPLQVDLRYIDPNVTGGAIPEQMTLAQSVSVSPFSPAACLSASCSPSFDDLIFWVGGAWIGGVILFGCVTGRRVVSELGLLGQSEPAPPALCDSVARVGRQMRLNRTAVRTHESLASPVVLWWRRTFLIWPKALADTADQLGLRAVLAHELAHIRRGDHFAVWLETLVALIHWWNPVFWFVRGQLRETREMACDAIAMRATDQSRHEYVEMLMKMTTSQWSVYRQTQVGLGPVSLSSLKRRISMVFKKNVSGQLSVIGFLVAGCILAISFTGFAQSNGEGAADTDDLPVALDGAWKLVSVELEGQEKQLDDDVRWVIEKNKVFYGGEPLAALKDYKGSTPTGIDLTFHEPRKEFEGIYSMKADRLKICLNTKLVGPKERPFEFSTKDKPNLRILSFQRVSTVEKGLGSQKGFVGMALSRENGGGDVVVGTVLENSPAAKAGVRAGDILLSIGNTDVQDLESAVNNIRGKIPGSDVRLRVSREGRKEQIEVKVAVFPFLLLGLLD